MWWSMQGGLSADAGADGDQFLVLLFQKLPISQPSFCTPAELVVRGIGNNPVAAARRTL
jgi:hypothetical protein